MDNTKFCKDCKYSYGDISLRCGHPNAYKYTEPVHGMRINTKCVEMRFSNGPKACGEEGRFFEPLPPRPWWKFWD